MGKCSEGYGDSKADRQGSQIRSMEAKITTAKAQIAIALKALKEINRVEVNAQRPGGDLGTSARISYKAINDIEAIGEI